MALSFLQDLCCTIKEIYPHGAKLVICSDGHVFSDLVGVADETVTQYGYSIKNTIEKNALSHLDIFNLNHAFADDDFSVMREHLLTQFATPLEQLKYKLKHTLDGRILFNGIHRFMFEDQLVLNKSASRNAIRRYSKQLVYQVIQRSNAWGKLIKHYFPHALRLSIHPQRPRSDKIGIKLLKTANIWRTPWHGVVLETGKETILTTRKHAEQLGAELITHQGQPSHYKITDEY